MFDDKGRPIIRRTRGSDIEQLRALASDEIIRGVATYREKLETLLEDARKIAALDVSAKGRLMRLETLVNGINEKADVYFTQRIEELDQGYRRLTFAFLSSAHREFINVPASAADKKRAAVIPSDADEVKKKRKTPAATQGAKKRKTRKKKTINPQKAAARKASVASRKAEEDAIAAANHRII